MGRASMRMSASFESVPERTPEQEARTRAEAEAELEAEAKRRELAPSPPEALRGIEGIHFADEKLKELRAVGILIGGVAKEIVIRGNTDPGILSSRKDVDILIPAGFSDHAYHPTQWEGGIDWWITHNASEAPTNGPANLIVAPELTEKAYKRLAPGLYLCNPEMLVDMEYYERLKDIKLDDSVFKEKEFWEYRENVGYGFVPTSAIGKFKAEHSVDMLDINDMDRQYQIGYWRHENLHSFETKAKHCKPL